MALVYKLIDAATESQANKLVALIRAQRLVQEKRVNQSGWSWLNYFNFSESKQKLNVLVKLETTCIIQKEKAARKSKNDLCGEFIAQINSGLIEEGGVKAITDFVSADASMQQIENIRAAAKLAENQSELTKNIIKKCDARRFKGMRVVMLRMLHAVLDSRMIVYKGIHGMLGGVITGFGPDYSVSRKEYELNAKGKMRKLAARVSEDAADDKINKIQDLALGELKQSDFEFENARGLCQVLDELARGVFEFENTRDLYRVLADRVEVAEGVAESKVGYVDAAYCFDVIKLCVRLLALPRFDPNDAKFDSKDHIKEMKRALFCSDDEKKMRKYGFDSTASRSDQLKSVIRASGFFSQVQADVLCEEISAARYGVRYAGNSQ